MKLATWNLQRLVSPSDRKMAPIRAHMDAVNADIWVLTETGEEISPGAGYAGIATTGSDRDQEPGEVWTKVWSRWPVEALPPTSDPVRCVAARVVHPQRGAFVVYGTVLPWSGSSWRGLRGAGGVAFGAALDAQASDWAALRAEFPADDLFVMGDLNQQLGVGSPWYYGSKVNGRRLSEALARLGLVAFTAGDNDPVRRGSNDLACIDHICGPALRASHVRRTSRWPDAPKPVDGLSDHFGMAVELDDGGGQHSE